MKEKIALVLLTLLLSSCEVQNNSSNSCQEEEVRTERVIIFAPSTVMVCHNPESKSHRQLCTSDCYQTGSTNAYCYELPTDLCNEGWQRESWVGELCEELAETL